MATLTAVLVAGALSFSLQSDKQEEDKKAAEAVKSFKIAYAQAGEAEVEKIKAVRFLAEVIHKKTMSVLGGLVSNPAETIGVRVAAADALGTFRGIDGASRPLMSAAQQKERRSDARRAACRGLGELRAEEALGLLHALVRDKQSDVAREAVIAIGKIRHKSSIPLLVETLRELEKQIESNEADPLGGVAGVVVPPSVGNNNNFPGLGGLGGVALGGGVTGNDARREAEERRMMLQDPTNKALASITREKWTTSKEWTIWWGRNASTFQVPK